MLNLIKFIAHTFQYTRHSCEPYEGPEKGAKKRAKHIFNFNYYDLIFITLSFFFSLTDAAMGFQRSTKIKEKSQRQKCCFVESEMKLISWSVALDFILAHLFNSMNFSPWNIKSEEKKALEGDEHFANGLRIVKIIWSVFESYSKFVVDLKCSMI